jgi:hypothetical protein
MVAAQIAADLRQTVTWRVNAVVPPLPQGFTVEKNLIYSTGGAFVTDTGRVQTLGTVASLPPQLGNNATFTEPVVLSADAIRQAVQLKAQRILLVRTFEQIIVASDLQNNTLRFLDSRSEAIAYYLTPSAGGPFAIVRAALRFDEGQPIRVIESNQKLNVWADLIYNGSGRLEGVWEVADARSTPGTPIYRPLRRVVRLLGTGQRISIRGPELPRRQPGLYLVRFRILEPAGIFEEPVIRYFVTAPGPVAPPAPRPIALKEPADLSVLEADTSFAWRPIPGAVVYRLELFDAFEAALPEDEPVFTASGERFRDVRSIGAERPPFEKDAQDPLRPVPTLPEGARPLTGVLLRAAEPEAILSGVTRSHLQPGRSYLWRVQAIGEGGVTLGESPLRRLQLPLPPSTPPDS